MTLYAHVAPHPDALVGRLAELVADPVGEVFDAEVVVVPTRGVERWLTQRIAVDLAAGGVGDGICAHVDFPSPRRLVRTVMESVPVLADSAAAWEGPALTHRVMMVIDDCLPEPWMAVLRRHLESTPSPATNRLAAAGKITGLFSRYARRRPGMVRDWASGREVGGTGRPLAAEHRWQYRLWREVRDRVGVASLAELLPAALAPLVDGSADPRLPGRVSVYGLTGIDPLDLEVVRALAARRDVHLHLLHPSPALWDAASTRLSQSGRASVRPRGADPTVDLPLHPLLASWATESRELQVVLADRGVEAEGPGLDDGAPGTVLGRLQQDIRHNRTPTVSGELDDSIQIHVCHGIRRQVEVARDALLHTLAADPGLEPRDVVIMTPDLDTFAPLLEAAFPAGETAEAAGLPDLRLRIADRSPAAVNPLVRFAAAVLELAGSRLEAGLVRELVTRPVVQHRFGFDREGAGRIIGLVDHLDVRWGLDADHRAEWGLEGRPENTWRRGLDRAMAGLFLSDDPLRVVEDVAPVAGIEGQDADPAGHLAAIVDRLLAVRELLADPMPVSRWSAAIATAVRLLAAPAWGEEWQWNQLDRLLRETFPPGGVAGEAAGEPSITAAEARGAVSVWTEDRPSPLHFQSGDITVCTLVPMRSVPYRVVCLLGMDDDRFPRRGRHDGDDLLSEQAVVGDSDRSSEDRQLLLDAVMAAGDRLIITHAGRDELTNAVVPPAVPVAELREVVELMRGGDSSFVVAHPLQAFDRRNFTEGALGSGGPWGFDARALAGARAAARPPAASPAPPWALEEPPAVVTLDELAGFLIHPAKHFAEQRLGISLSELADPADDTLPTRLGPLEGWGVKDRVLGGLLAGHGLQALLARERAGDAVPPGALGAEVLRRAGEEAVALRDAAVRRGLRAGGDVRLAGTVALGDRAVEGTVWADPLSYHQVVATPSRLRAGKRLRSFLELAFLTALHPERPWRGMLIGRNDRGPGNVAVGFGPLGDDAERRQAMAEWVLRRYLELFDRGRHAPLPMPCGTGHAWQLQLTRKGREAAYEAARRQWEEDTFEPENRDPYHRLLFPHLAVTSELVQAGFEHHCERLWEPVLRFMDQEEA